MEKNILLAGVSSGTYFAISQDIDESLIFGVINGIMQEFVPKLVQDEKIQLLFIDPIISSLVNAAVKYYFYDSHVGKELSRGIVCGVSGSTITNFLYYGDKRW